MTLARSLLSLTLMTLAATAHAAPARPAKAGLPRDVALERSRRVSQPVYELSFQLDGAAPDFIGTATVTFSLLGAQAPLTLDFNGGAVQALEVNGKPLKPDYNGFFLTLPASALVPGQNQVAVRFTHPYSMTGEGLHRTQDPADGRVYLYSDFEPYDANRLFPCFDQPGLKAVYRLSVEAPEDWEVVTATLESEVRKAAGGRRRWTFPATQPISTYLVSLHAGPYIAWKASAGDVPLRLLARRSLAEHVDVDDWFRVTQQGLAFYQKYFESPYPFGKLDQVIVPDFNAGAMENVAAITYSERFVHRSKTTAHQRLNRANVILHEIAHQWFGDLVTMKWWDDLWLNESFASFMANLALAEATEFADSWTDFLLGMKQWGLWEDQLVTTHPIESQAPDTEQAFSNFDGITYGKGASVLKQAAYLLGPEGFRTGVARYLERHAFGTAERQDFVASLEEASGQKLGDWTRDWLRTAGVNTVRADFQCRDGKIASFRLLQSAPPEHPTLRLHKTRIGLFAAGENGSLRFLLGLPNVEYAGAETAVPALVGEECPALVLPNQGDPDFVKVKLDAKGVEAVRAGLSSLPSELDRAQLWAVLWGMVQDGELSAKAYSDLAMKHLPYERGADLRDKVLQRVLGRYLNSPSLIQYLNGEGPAWDAFAPKYAAQLEGFFWVLFENAAPESDEQKQWFDAFARAARLPESLRKLAGVLDGSIAVRGFLLDQDRRWDVIAQLNRFAAPGSRELIAAEAARDPSRRGQMKALRAAVLRPEWETKEAWLKKIGDPAVSLEEQKTVMHFVFPFEQAAFRRRYAPQFGKDLKRLSKAATNEFLDSLSEQLAPATCRPEDSAALDKLLKETDLPPVASKALRVARQENERCVRIRALAASSLSD